MQEAPTHMHYIVAQPFQLLTLLTFPLYSSGGRYISLSSVLDYKSLSTLQPATSKNTTKRIVKNGNRSVEAMDWYSWLYKTNLDPSLVYEYGLSFTRNELQEEDLCHLNHEILQSMGIAVAKHRLEILKLARKEAAGKPKGLSRLVSAINKTKKILAKKLNASVTMPKSELTPYRTQWTGALRKINEQSYEKGSIMRRNSMKSGPLDGRVQEKGVVSNRSLSISGPLDGKVNERLMYSNKWSPKRTGLTTIDGHVKKRYQVSCKSPYVSGPLEVDKLGGFEEAHSLWSLMFQDMKPT